MASADEAMLQVLDVPRASGQVAAIGPTEDEGVFVAFILGGGVEYLDLSGKGHWAKAARSAEPAAGALGLHWRRGDGGAAGSAQVSFVEASLRAWICLRIPAAGAGADVADAEEVARTSLPAEVAAACSVPQDPAAAIVLKSGAVRFLDLSTGKAPGKGLKLEPQHAQGMAALARLGPYRVALVRAGQPADPTLEFFVVAFDGESQKALLQLEGKLSSASPGRPLGSFVGAAAAGPLGEPSQGRVILCWQSREEGSVVSDAPSLAFAAVALDREAPNLALLPHSGRGSVAWSCVKGYLAEWSPEENSAPGGSLKMIARDTRFGMFAASAKMPHPAKKGGARLLVATAGGTTLLVGSGRVGLQATAVQWVLPSFALHMVVGRGVAKQPGFPEWLGPLTESFSGKRPREDPAVEELFSAKRHAATDRALASEVRRRRVAPSLELVNEIVQRGCWAAASALLSLPELDEDLSVKLLSARLQLLARVVRRAHAPHLLEQALRDNLPASQLPKVLEVLLQWLEAYRDFPEEKIRRQAPGIPDLAEVVTFLGALADGCLPLLAHLEVDLLERTLEALIRMQKEARWMTALYASVREAYRIRRPLRPQTEAPAIEVVILGES